MRSAWECNILTPRNCIHLSSPRQKVSKNNSHVDGEKNDTCRPSDCITDEIELLLSDILCPEADATDQEGPVGRTTGVRVRCREAARPALRCNVNSCNSKLPEKSKLLRILWGVVSVRSRLPGFN